MVSKTTKNFYSALFTPLSVNQWPCILGVRHDLIFVNMQGKASWTLLKFVLWLPHFAGQLQYTSPGTPDRHLVHYWPHQFSHDCNFHANRQDTRSASSLFLYVIFGGVNLFADQHYLTLRTVGRGWGTSKHNCLVSYLLCWRRHVSATVGHLQVTKMYIEENYTEYDHSIGEYCKPAVSNLLTRGALFRINFYGGAPCLPYVLQVNGV